MHIGESPAIDREYRSEGRQNAHLALEIHDAIASHVVTARLLAEQLRDLSPGGGTRQSVDELCSELDLALRDLRTFCFLLDQKESADFDCQHEFRSIVEGFSRRAKLYSTFVFHAREQDIPAATRQTMMRILQEALVNVACHANATEVHVGIRRLGEMFELKVEDNGNGIAPEAARGIGLSSIMRRARRIGGESIIDSDATGTTVTAWLPLHPSLDD